MSPLALIPIGLYAFIATVSAESAIEAESPFEPTEKVSLKENVTPPEIQKREKSSLPNTSALSSSFGLTDPVAKAAIAKTLKMRPEQNNQQLIQKSTVFDTSRGSVENPGQYFLKTEADDDGGYSAPLGLTDESHNDWIK